jgi:hypothetical protein
MAKGRHPMWIRYFMILPVLLESLDDTGVDRRIIIK